MHTESMPKVESWKPAPCHARIERLHVPTRLAVLLELICIVMIIKIICRPNDLVLDQFVLEVWQALVVPDMFVPGLHAEDASRQVVHALFVVASLFIEFVFNVRTDGSSLQVPAVIHWE